MDVALYEPYLKQWFLLTFKETLRKRVLETWTEYIDAAVQLQRALNENQILDIESFWATRILTSGTYITQALLM